MRKIAKVTRNFRVTIPTEIRTAVGIKEGDFVIFSVEKGKIVITPLKKKRLTYRAGFKISVEEMERIVEEMYDKSD